MENTVLDPVRQPDERPSSPCGDGARSQAVQPEAVATPGAVALEQAISSAALGDLLDFFVKYDLTSDLRSTPMVRCLCAPIVVTSKT